MSVSVCLSSSLPVRLSVRLPPFLKACETGVRDNKDYDTYVRVAMVQENKKQESIRLSYREMYSHCPKCW